MGGSICLWLSLTTLNSEEFTLLWQFLGGGIIWLWYLYVYICTGISLYFVISWLFQMGSHWWHWTVKSSLCALAVSKGGSVTGFTQVKLEFPYIFLSVDCFEWTLIDNIEQRRVHSVLWQFRMGGVLSVFPGKSDNLSSFQVLLLLHRALSCLVRNERPKMQQPHQVWAWEVVDITWNKWCSTGRPIQVL